MDKEKVIQAKHEPLNRISFRLYPTDKQKLTNALPSDLSFTFHHLVTQVINGDISVQYLADYPKRPKQKEDMAMIQTAVGPQLKLMFDNYCIDRGYTASQIARGLAYAIIDQKITLKFDMKEEVKK